MSFIDWSQPWKWVYNIKLWVPFGRMSASVFLAHFTFIWYDIPNSHEYIPTRVYNLVMKFTYNLFMSYVYSYIIYLLFEAPSMSWAKGQIRKEMANRTQAAEREHMLKKVNKLGEHNVKSKSSKLKGA